MNRTKLVLLLIASLVAVATCLFPPMSWIEVVPISGGRTYVVDSHGIYHDEPGIIFRRGLRFVGHADDGRILWKTLAIEWIVLASIIVLFVFFYGSRPPRPSGHP